MKYAYLIIAHNEFDVLNKLIESLDDERNDIFVHIDRKVKNLPRMSTRKSGLYVLENRVDTRWGNVSQIETEYALFETAYAKGGYSRYIMLSGVHLPLKTQDYIHDWFDERGELEIMAPVPNNAFQEDQKMRRYNLFTRSFSSSITAQRFWALSIAAQRLFGVRRNRGKRYEISSNWVCLTENAVGCLLKRKAGVMKEWKYSFCGDEFFVRSVLAREGFEERIVVTDVLLKCDFDGASTPRTYHMSDYDELSVSDCIFARKFSGRDIALIDRLLEKIGND